ncbi:MAG TPA: hypothetical protein VGG48_01835 [Rhizomicrobium sp.]|jgi:hypothetical protein
MTMRLGTRTLQGQRREHPSEAGSTRSYTRDKSMSKNVTASITFSAADGKLEAANGTFTAFVAGDPVFVQGTNLNNGDFIITAIDATNSAYLAVDPAPKDEGPLSATVRTP